MSPEIIAIIDTGVANKHSVKNAFEFIGANVQVTDCREEIEAASKLVFPGVGSFGAGINSLEQKDLIGPLTEQVFEKKKPILGLCLGYQMMFEGSEEEDVKGLGWLKGFSKKITVEDPALKVPHIGFNDVTFRDESPMGRGIGEMTPFYHLHSYFVETDKDYWACTTNYEKTFLSGIVHENFWGTQFHPEKSQVPGLTLLKNFVELS